MIELPRAALRAGDIAEHVDFFSFGTNDPTQTTYGIIRRRRCPGLLGGTSERALRPRSSRSRWTRGRRNRPPPSSCGKTRQP